MTTLKAITVLLCLGAALLGSSARADFIYLVSIDTSALVGNPNTPFALDVQLIDGDPTASNTVTLTNFNLGGGTTGFVVAEMGGSSGDMFAGITLTDSAFLNFLVQEFSPGSILSFDLTITGNVGAGPTPDRFSLAIDYTDPTTGDLLQIPTLAPDAVSLIAIDFDSTNPTVSPFASPEFDIPAPTVRLRGVPEPASLALLAGGLIAAAARSRWSRRRCA